MRAPRSIIGIGVHLRVHNSAPDGATRAVSSCSQRGSCKFTGALSEWSREWGGELRLRRPSRACGVAVECSIASMLKDRATQSVGPAVLQNDGFACTGVKSPMCENSDNMALLNPSLMFNAFRARCTKRANSDCATAKFRGVRARVCYHSPSKVT